MTCSNDRLFSLLRAASWSEAEMKSTMRKPGDEAGIISLPSALTISEHASDSTLIW